MLYREHSHQRRSARYAPGHARPGRSSNDAGHVRQLISTTGRSYKNGLSTRENEPTSANRDGGDPRREANSEVWRSYGRRLSYNKHPAWRDLWLPGLEWSRENDDDQDACRPAGTERGPCLYCWTRHLEGTHRGQIAPGLCRGSSAAIRKVDGPRFSLFSGADAR